MKTAKRVGSRPLARCALGICLVALAVWPASAQGRVDLFDRQGRRQGSAVIDQESGRVDFYDRQGRRTGWGHVSPSGLLERFDRSGRRQHSPRERFEGEPEGGDDP